ncbi:MAG: thioesterase family protein [Lapillicoccus sp.]
MASDARRSWTRRDFPVLLAMPTRWADNDMFGHLNNAVYYELFDTAINGWLAGAGGVDAATTPELGVVAESGCIFYREVGFHQPLTVGMRVERLGRSSVTYALGVFGGGPDDGPSDPAEATVAAVGHWVHVYVDRTTRRATPMPDAVRTALQGMLPGETTR